MKFVDEARIKVIAGDGGNGCMSFRREKYIRKGDDMIVPVPLGTVATDLDTGEQVADMNTVGERVMVARGGFHGLGNTRFKSSVNRAPRQTKDGTPGERRDLQLELRVLADIGLLGYPNAGKSTFISAVSQARPKVADYPFTTLHPNLGVVSIEPHRSFVIADIPGLIEGASSGQGLGIQFLRHLARTTILLHLIDCAPIDGSDPIDQAVKLLFELKQYSDELADKERWVVFTKLDLLTPDDQQTLIKELTDRLGHDGPVYSISAISKLGTHKLCTDIMERMERAREEAKATDVTQTTDTPEPSECDND